MNAVTSSLKFEGELIKIKLVNDDENEYFLNPSFEDNSIDMIDLNNNRIYGVNQYNLLGVFMISKINSIFELKKKSKNYLFCSIGEQDKDQGIYYIIFKKYIFKKVDISQTNSIEQKSSSEFIDELKVYRGLIISCFEIEKYDIIECFYVNTTHYLTIGLFKEDSYELIKSEVIEETVIPSDYDRWSDFFHQCIHLKNEISILGYTLGKNVYNNINLQIKQIVYNNYHLKI